MVVSLIGDEPIASDLSRAWDVTVFGGQSNPPRGNILPHLPGVVLGLIDGHLVGCLPFNRWLSTNSAQCCAIVPGSHLIATSQSNVSPLVRHPVSEIIDDFQAANHFGWYGGRRGRQVVITPVAGICPIRLEMPGCTSHQDGI